MRVAFLIRASLQFAGWRTCETGDRSNPDEILSLLAEVALRGSGFVTECLLDYVLDEGFTEPIYLNASGEDPDAYFRTVTGLGSVSGSGMETRADYFGRSRRQRRVQITETP